MLVSMLFLRPLVHQFVINLRYLPNLYYLLKLIERIAKIYSHLRHLFSFWHAFWEYPHALMSQPHVEECGEKLKLV